MLGPWHFLLRCGSPRTNGGHPEPVTPGHPPPQGPLKRLLVHSGNSQEAFKYCMERGFVKKLML